MTARQLKTALMDVPDDAVVLRPGMDHSYRPAFIRIAGATALHDVDLNDWSEDYGDPLTPEKPPGIIRKKVVIVT